MALEVDIRIFLSFKIIKKRGEMKWNGYKSVVNFKLFFSYIIEIEPRNISNGKSFFTCCKKFSTIRCNISTIIILLVYYYTQYLNHARVAREFRQGFQTFDR